MATPAAVLSVLVQADGIARTNRQLQGLHGDLDKSSRAAGKMGDDLEKSSKKGSKAFSALKSTAGVAAGALGAVGLAGAFGAVMDEYREAQKVGANTNQVIKSTGGIANVTAKHVGDLSVAISKKAGIDDEAIQSGANLLLTFKNIRNEAGKGRDIFDQATKAAVDLSAAGFGDLTATSKQLGKALNDPVKGITALGRSGVTFSDQQKKAIAALVATGKVTDRVKAQQIILKEVQSQVGGQAEAQATAGDHLKVSLGNLAEAAGGVLVPALDKVATFLSNLIDQMVSGKGVGGSIIATFKNIGGSAYDLGKAVAALIGWFKQHTTVTYALAAAIGVVLAAFAGFKILAAVQAGIIAVRGAMLLLNAAFLTNPIVLVTVALAGLAAAIVVAYKESKTFRDVVNAVWGAIKTATVTVWNFLKGFLLALWGVLKTAITTYFNAYKTIITGVWTAIQTVTTTVWGAIKTAATGVWNGIKAVATTTWDGIKTVILTPIRAVRDALGGKDGIWAKMHDAAESAWDKIKTGATNFASSIGDAVKGAFEGVVNKVIDFVNAIIHVINLIPGVPNIDKIGHIGGSKGGKSSGGAGGPHGTGKLARGGAFGRTGGLINKPITMMGEEAPRFPEYVIPTNPAYRGRAKGLLGQAANAVGLAGGGLFGGQQGNGRWNVGMLESLWKRVGGAEGMARTMAMIATAESGVAGQYGNQFARNPSGASGLWQILGQEVPGNIFDPVVNAKNALWKLAHQGLGAWASSRPAWGPLVKDGGFTGAVGHVLSALNPADFIKKLPGVGGLPDWLKGTGKYVLSHVADWIKDKVASVVTSDDGGHATGSVAAAIKLAQGLGFGYPSQGQLTGGDHVAGSLHYAGRAVDFGDAGHTQKQMESLFYGLYAKFGTNLNELFYDRMPWYIDAHSKHLGQIGGHKDHIHAAFANGGFARGWGLVGERGPELVNFGARGGQVYSNPDSAQMMGRGVTINVDTMNVGSRTDENSWLARIAFRVATAS